MSANDGGKIIDLMEALKQSLAVAQAKQRICMRCNRPETLHTGVEKFCPIIATFCESTTDTASHEG